MCVYVSIGKDEPGRSVMAAYKIPVRFKRVAAVFDSEVARARLICESSGSEHSPADQSLTDLSDLVNSFLEREGAAVHHAEVDGDININNNIGVGYDDEDDDDDGKLTLDSDKKFSETREILQDLFRNQSTDELQLIKRSIHDAVENALPEIMNEIGFIPDYKRRLMSMLRRRGFDAGICKSRWEKSGNCPSGSYEYIDILMSGKNRYVVEICLAKEFDIAKPSSHYSALLKMFPLIFVCQKEELKKLTRLMCKSMKKSMKSAGLNVPPWRRLAYTQAKWFSSYRRTVNEFPTDLNSDDQELSIIRKKRSVGFRTTVAPSPAIIPFRCRDEQFFAAKMLAPKVSYLALAMKDDGDDDQ